MFQTKREKELRSQIKVYVDTETNVMYWLHFGVHACDIQVMVDADGKPLLWEGR